MGLGRRRQERPGVGLRAVRTGGPGSSAGSPNDHDYRKAGIYNVKATFRRSGRTLAQATVRVTVRAGLGDNTIE